MVNGNKFIQSIIDDINLFFERDAGTCLVYRFGFVQGDEIKIINKVVSSLEPKYEVSTPNPENGDCQLEVRNYVGQLEVKRGCHGCYGAWKRASTEEAVQWLLPGQYLPERI